jgi:CBS domain-containing protein
MLAKDIMSLSLEVIDRKASALMAAKKMAVRGIGVLPVVDGNKLVGIVTDRDLVVRAMARGVNPEAIEVDLVMTQEVITCKSEDDISHVVHLMERHQLRRIIVTDSDDAPIGVIAVEDIAAKSTDKQSAAAALYRGAGGSPLQMH